MVYKIHYRALRNFPNATRHASFAKYESIHVICVEELTCWHSVCSHNFKHHFLRKRSNSSFFRLPAAGCTCRFTYFASLSCTVSLGFCVSIIFEFLITYHFCMLSSTPTPSSWKGPDFLISSLIPPSVIRTALSPILLPAFKTEFNPLLTCRCDAALHQDRSSQNTASKSQKIALPFLCTRALFLTFFRFRRYFAALHLCSKSAMYLDLLIFVLPCSWKRELFTL